ncbi:carboxymethylenebutenolidase [Methylobacterium variabile]|jgi:carboxymethylenebutenolidase|uniref:Carboxymethylenebutenolidase n=1 Tax=Methylobacterium variabile TaxID=298794 RepID=A0A0J6SXI2_9HYPH|nr:dienelactone hydrolase family protein [Methylobacterium variabile]KMO39940.1 carboxymethylenebutenolidase [Methylobacterium variabile]
MANSDEARAGAATDLEQLDGLVIPPFSRRGFVMTGLMSGLTLATTRVEAQAIRTDEAGIVAGEVRIPVGDGPMPAYRAMPEGPGPFPIVLVVEEIFGVHEYIKDICRRLAKAGYTAVAPELFARQGDVSKMTDVQEIVREVVSKTPDAQVMGDLDASAAWAAAEAKGDPGKLGITGWCRGGRTVWLYAAHSASLKAGVAWYGNFGGNRTGIQPKTAADVIPDIRAPILGLYGASDAGIPVADVEKARDAAKAAGKTVDIVIFPDAPHGFHADYRPSYRKGPAEDGWARMLAWFRQHGVA